MVNAKNNYLKKILSVFLAVLSIFSVFSVAATPAYAATSTSYTVTTKANYWYPGGESITIKQSKEVYYSNMKKTKTKKRNMYYVVTCTPTSWSGSKPATITKNFSGNSLKIGLAKNATYRVTIKPSVSPGNVYGNFGVKSSGYAYISGACKATYY